MSYKVVVAGPPHSGKSVFLGGLTKCLPRDTYSLFRACPDGEGSWTWRTPDGAKYRRKGTFTRETVDWYVKCLSTANLAPLTLVDIGGRITEENRCILCDGKVNAAIILAGDMNAVPAWRAFMESCGVSVKAEIHSDYHGQTDRVDTMPMVVHYLERGVDVSSRPTIQKTAAMLLDMVASRVSPDLTAGSGRKEGSMMMGLDNILKISALAAELGKAAGERTLPNGRVVSQITWEGADLVSVARLLHNKSAHMPECVDIDGAAPAWLVAALTHEVHPRSVRLNSPDGYVPVGCARPAGSGAGVNLEFKVSSREDGWVTVLAQQADPSIPLDPADLGKMAPPALPMGAKVILSGRMPNWAMASLAMAYHGMAKAVALFQPGTGSTVAWTHSAEVELGSIIAE